MEFCSLNMYSIIAYFPHKANSMFIEVEIRNYF